LCPASPCWDDDYVNPSQRSLQSFFIKRSSSNRSSDVFDDPSPLSTTSTFEDPISSASSSASSSGREFAVEPAGNSGRRSCPKLVKRTTGLSQAWLPSEDAIIREHYKLYGGDRGVNQFSVEYQLQKTSLEKMCDDFKVNSTQIRTRYTKQLCGGDILSPDQISQAKYRKAHPSAASVRGSQINGKALPFKFEPHHLKVLEEQALLNSFPGKEVFAELAERFDCKYATIKQWFDRWRSKNKGKVRGQSTDNKSWLPIQSNTRTLDAAALPALRAPSDSDGQVIVPRVGTHKLQIAGFAISVDLQIEQRWISQMLADTLEPTLPAMLAKIQRGDFGRGYFGAFLWTSLYT
jgi:hypothetical protein